MILHEVDSRSHANVRFPPKADFDEALAFDPLQTLELLLRACNQWAPHAEIPAIEGNQQVIAFVQVGRRVPRSRRKRGWIAPDSWGLH